MKYLFLEAMSLASPLYLDRVEGPHVVLVEGVLDAACAQAAGDPRVVALGRASVTVAQAATLHGHGIRSATILLDGDKAGDDGIEPSLRVLEAAGINSYVAPRLTEGQDPDDLIRSQGLAAWQAHVAAAVSAPEWRLRVVLDGIPERGPEREQRLARACEILARPIPASEAKALRQRVAKAFGMGVRELGTRLREEVDEDAGVSYELRAGELYWLSRTKDGVVPVRLCGFAPGLTAEILTDDGGSDPPTRCYELACARQGEPPVTLELPADHVEDVKAWKARHLGAKWELGVLRELGAHVRAALEALRPDPLPLRHRYAHLGWRKHGGQWVYLHGQGAIGAAGHVSVLAQVTDLPRFGLPAPPDGDALREAVRASLRMLAAGSLRVTLPLWASVWRAVLGGADAGVFVEGPTQVLKSELAALAQQHFGAGMHRRGLPANWSSTANSVLEAAYLAQDSLLVVDDWTPKPSRAAQERAELDLDRLMRGAANAQGRGRLRVDHGKLVQQGDRPPRCLPVVTGELLPRLPSLLARMLVVQVGPDDLDPDAMAACRRDGATGLYAHALAGFVRWLAPDLEAWRAAIPGHLDAWRVSLRPQDLGRRAASLAGELVLGLDLGRRFAVAVGALTEAESTALRTRGVEALLGALADQRAETRGDDPANSFLAHLGAAIAQGDAHVTSTENDAPLHAEARGWRRPWPGAGWEPRGAWVGWIAGEHVYLDPGAAYYVASRHAQAVGLVLLPEAALWRRMGQAGVLVEHEHSRRGWKTRKARPGSGATLSVIALDLKALGWAVVTADSASTNSG